MQVRLALATLAAAFALSSDADLGVVLHAWRAVLVKEGGAERPVGDNEPLRIGQTLRSGPTSWARMRFDRDGTLDIHAGTRVSFDPPGAPDSVATVWLDRGTIRLVHDAGDPYSSRKVEIKTRTAVIALRGTEVLVTVGPVDATVVSVLQGEVVVTSQSTHRWVAAKKGEQYYVGRGTDPVLTTAPEGRRDAPFPDSPLFDRIKP